MHEFMSIYIVYAPEANGKGGRLAVRVTQGRRGSNRTKYQHRESTPPPIASLV
jgi:hypothetical protein